MFVFVQFVNVQQVELIHFLLLFVSFLSLYSLVIESKLKGFPMT